MDSMHPDPTPAPPPSLSEIRAHVSRLEASHRARGLPLSGRIIHVCHHLPVEIVRIVSSSSVDIPGVFSPPMTPEFLPEDADASVESVDAKWRIQARIAHTAMVSGLKSLSESHEQIVVAWTGEVLVQTQNNPSPPTRTTSTFGSFLPAQFDGTNGDVNPTAPTLTPRDEKSLMLYGHEFNEAEQKELWTELDRFTEVETEAENGGRLKYVPVFLPADVSKGHYEGFCKKSESPCPSSLTSSSLAALPLPSLARFHCYCPFPRPPLDRLPQSQYPLCRESRRDLSPRRSHHCP